MTYPQIFADQGPFDEEPVPERPIDPEVAFVAFVAATIVLIVAAGLFVVLLTQPPW